jgi:TRAP-type C4-dicarboxylate transport system permease small subunit
MIKNINKNLSFLYIGSGYLAAFFLIAVLIFILTGISSRIFGFYIRGLAEYSGYSMAASSFFALSYTFYDKAHIRITLFLEKLKPFNQRLAEIWCLFVATIFSGVFSILFY